jgi:Endonuclease-reverse transcriptase
LIVGDFNTHSPAWSPVDIPRSSWAGRIEEWAATNLLTLANNPGEITRRGADHERDSVIDLAWYNEAAIQKSTFTDLKIDWSGSLGSNHALLQITGQTWIEPAQTLNNDLGFITDPEQKEQWIAAFKDRTLPLILPFTPTAEEVERAAAGLLTDIQNTNEQIFRRQKPHHPKAAPWWNAACAVTAENLRNA